jgi:DNA-binding NarL/FixJ family response regulator
VRTLIVDDSEVVREGLSQLLETQPYCEIVGAVSEPEEALELARTTHPDVVLQDFSMPGVDAIALVRALCAFRPQPAVLMLSAFSDAPSARQAMEAGALGWVLKDAEPEQLFAALLGAVGFGDRSRATALGGERRSAMLTAVPELAPSSDADPDFEIATPLDARTVRALLRALQSDPAGLTVEDLANRAVLPVAMAVRYIQRLSTRHPALVAEHRGAGPRTYVLTGAGHVELERLERRIPEARAQAHAARTLLR